MTWQFWELKRGTHGKPVQDAQADMTEIGAYEGTIHGVFDPDFEKAVIRFQKAHGIWPNGVWNKLTRDTCRAVQKAQANPEPPILTTSETNIPTPQKLTTKQ